MRRAKCRLTDTQMKKHPDMYLRSINVKSVSKKRTPKDQKHRSSCFNAAILIVTMHTDVHTPSRECAQTHAREERKGGWEKVKRHSTALKAYRH